MHGLAAPGGSGELQTIDPEPDGTVRSRLSALLPATAAAVAACSDLTFAIRAGGPLDAPEIVIVLGRPFTLETRLVSGAVGGGLRAALAVRGRGPEPVPWSLRADSAWVYRGEEAWATELSTTDAPANELRAVAQGGPTWPAGTEVEVVVRLETPEGSRYLRAARQRIE